ncbi:hypothetical protein [Synechocystis sp. CACIAM 05]|nr:hypothetical protein [Synechocystis sp. CACIAM 05]
MVTAPDSPVIDGNQDQQSEDYSVKQKAPPIEGECNLQIIQLALHQGINR